MDAHVSNFLLSTAAGFSSLRHPYSLLLLPILLDSVKAKNRFLQLAFVTGFIIATAPVGVFAVSIGAYNYDNLAELRLTSSAVMSMSAITLLFITISEDVDLSENIILGSPIGKMMLGLALGAIWSPCVAPELFNFIMASDATSSVQMTLKAIMFSIGAVVPLMILGAIFKSVILYWHSRVLVDGLDGIKIFSGILLLVGILIMSGLDQSFHSDKLQFPLMMQSR